MRPCKREERADPWPFLRLFCISCLCRFLITLPFAPTSKILTVITLFLELHLKYFLNKIGSSQSVNCNRIKQNLCLLI